MNFDQSNLAIEPTAESASVHSDAESCPLCGGTNLSNRGTIYHPQPTRVAGIEIDLSAYDFQLLKCADCQFQFKSPAIPEDCLLECYAAATNDHWGLDVDPLERNFDRLAAAVQQFATGNKILDVGCFNGAFLDYLGDRWLRHGVEPSHGACRVAEKRGVTIWGNTLDDLPLEETFDVITAFDVIEHIVDPAPFFQHVRKHLKPGGIFVASSGDTGFLGWRLQGARFWYCSCLPEHISFFSQPTLDFIADKHQMTSIFHQHISHKRTPLIDRLKQSFNGYSYAVLMRTGWLGLPFFRHKFATRAGTAWGAATDHFIHVMRCE